MFVSRIKAFFKNLFLGIGLFFKRAKKSAKLMSKFEKRVALTFLFIALILFGVKAFLFYKERTVVVPGYGGVYSEAIASELKYINPIHASSDTDRAVSSLIFSGLLKYDKDNQIIPDLAEKWDVSEDKLKYTFYLKDGLKFHDGSSVTAGDVQFTVDSFQNPDLKSPFYEIWKDVVTTVLDERTIVFEIPKAYGPFIFNFDFGVVPSYLSFDDLSRKPIGAGPFKYLSSKSANEKISEMNLKRFDEYAGGRPYIDKLELSFYSQKNDAIDKFVKDKFISLSGAYSDREEAIDLSFSTPKRLALIANMRSERLKDKAFREKVFGEGKFEQSTKINMYALDSPIQRQKADELKQEFLAKNIELDVVYYKATELLEIRTEKKYELILYGFDFKHDQDPYLYWHTSQLENMNLAGYTNKNSDILLEDARMIYDNRERIKKYDQFFESIKGEYLIKIFDSIKFNFVVDDSLRGVDSIQGDDGASRYIGVEKWYLKERRVKK